MSQLRDVNSGIGNSGKCDLELKGILEHRFWKIGEWAHIHPAQSQMIDL